MPQFFIMIVYGFLYRQKFRLLIHMLVLHQKLISQQLLCYLNLQSQRLIQLMVRLSHTFIQFNKIKESTNHLVKNGFQMLYLTTVFIVILLMISINFRKTKECQRFIFFQPKCRLLKFTVLLQRLIKTELTSLSLLMMANKSQNNSKSSF